MQTGHLTGKRVLIGITGGIAAYRTLEFVRGVVKSGGEVQVILTEHALEFVTRVTVEALSGNPAHTELFAHRGEPGIDHIELAKWADVLVVAPATANIIGKMAHGIADDLLSTVYFALCTKCKVVVAPAMNTRMWEHPATQRNMQTLRADLSARLTEVGPQAKLLACGDWGMGAMAEPETILDAVTKCLADGSAAI